MTRSRAAHYFELLKGSYWFIPSVMALGSILLAAGLGLLDAHFGEAWLGAQGSILETTPGGARAVLGTIAGSMITVAGVIFSMTMVSVSFAAGQFGPRLIGNFMRDRGNQITLGVFIATFVYCLVVLRMVRSAESGDADELFGSFVPHSAVAFAMLAALACIAVLIYFIHHNLETINVGNLTAAVGKRLVAAVEDMFPERLGEGGNDRGLSAELLEARFEGGTSICSTGGGYVLAIDGDGLMQLARTHDTTFLLERRPGDFVTCGSPVIGLLPGFDPDDALVASLRNCYRLGKERTVEQNLLFLVDQLVEILGRALSPGVNDPFTARSCINWMRCGLEEMATRCTPNAGRRDDDGAVRIVARPLSFEDFAAAMFDQTKQYVAADRNAAVSMMLMIRDALARVGDDERRRILLGHARKLAAAAEVSLEIEADQEEVASMLRALEHAPQSEASSSPSLLAGAAMGSSLPSA
ncbi:MAG: DUF2254 domain-containing protein [Nannocystaceae bacterium]|nr:DUF2254 domain-containing protein [bacterium]